MSAKNKSDFIDIGDLIVKYSRYWRWFAVSIAACVLIGVLYIVIKDPVYYIVSSVKLRTEEEGSKVASSLVKSFGLGGLGGTENIDDEAAVMGSQSHMRDMIYSLGLQAKYELKKFPFDKTLYKKSPIVVEAAYNVIDTLSTPIKFKVKIEGQTAEIKAESNRKEIGRYEGSLPAKIKTDRGTYTLKYSGIPINKDKYRLSITLLGLNYAAELYREKISVGASDNKSNLIYLGLKETERERGKDILNKLVELYNQDTKEDKNLEASNTELFIEERIALLRNELDSIERQIEDYKRLNNVVNFEAESKAFISKYQELQEKNTEMEIQQSVNSMLKAFVSDPKNEYEPVPASSGAWGSSQDAINAYNGALLERSRLLRNLTESNPAVEVIEKRIGLLRKNVVASVDNTRKDIDVRKRDWSGLAGEMQARMSQMPQQEREYIELERQRQVKSELYVFLLTKLEETQLTLASTTPKAKIIDAAYNLWKPVAPKKRAVFGLALLIGLIFPVIAIYLKDAFKTKLYTKEELSEATNIPVLGEICLDKNAGNIAVSENAVSSTTELFRLLRTNLQFILKKDEKVLLVTSSIAGEGKTFFTVNLALSFSFIKNKRVVVVGLDIRSPKLAEYLSMDRRKGLTMFLASDAMKPEEIIVPRPDLHPNVFVVPAGPIPPNPSELLLGDRLDELFAYLRQNFDYIIVDTAPVGLVSDTFSLNRIADATIYLFRAGYTPKSNLKLAESIVEEEKLKRLSLVINGTTAKSAYGYGYGDKKKSRNS
jgi:capsular exopolysaccharide synthesis family protein